DAAAGAVDLDGKVRFFADAVVLADGRKQRRLQGIDDDLLVDAFFTVNAVDDPEKLAVHEVSSSSCRSARSPPSLPRSCGARKLRRGAPAFAGVQTKKWESTSPTFAVRPVRPVLGHFFCRAEHYPDRPRGCQRNSAASFACKC